MNIKEIISSLNKRFEYYKNQTKKELILTRICQEHICSDFYAFNVEIRYKKSNKLYKEALRPNKENREEIYNYLRNLDKNKRDNIFLEIRKNIVTNIF